MRDSSEAKSLGLASRRAERAGEPDRRERTSTAVGWGGSRCGRRPGGLKGRTLRAGEACVAAEPPRHSEAGPAGLPHVIKRRRSRLPARVSLRGQLSEGCEADRREASKGNRRPRERVKRANEGSRDEQSESLGERSEPVTERSLRSDRGYPAQRARAARPARLASPASIGRAGAAGTQPRAFWLSAVEIPATHESGPRAFWLSAVQVAGPPRESGQMAFGPCAAIGERPLQRVGP